MAHPMFLAAPAIPRVPPSATQTAPNTFACGIPSPPSVDKVTREANIKPATKNRTTCPTSQALGRCVLNDGLRGAGGVLGCDMASGISSNATMPVRTLYLVLDPVP